MASPFQVGFPPTILSAPNWRTIPDFLVTPIAFPIFFVWFVWTYARKRTIVILFTVVSATLLVSSFMGDRIYLLINSGETILTAFGISTIFTMITALLYWDSLGILLWKYSQTAVILCNLNAGLTLVSPFLSSYISQVFCAIIEYKMKVAFAYISIIPTAILELVVIIFLIKIVKRHLQMAE